MSIADQLNSYFSNIECHLSHQSDNQNEYQHLKFLRKSVFSSTFLEPTFPAEVFNAISSLNANKSPGLDGISTNFSKLAADIIAVPLSLSCNYSFLFGIFPDCMKVAKVVPLYKSGDRSNASNYRPISLLPCLSKVIEKLIYSRLTNFLNKHSILHQNQYGFCQGLSTSHALMDVATRIYDSIEKSFYTALVFVDYKKAFDTVCHGILFSKLERYGIRGSALGLISSYLNNRKQSVNNNGY